MTVSKAFDAVAEVYSEKNGTSKKDAAAHVSAALAEAWGLAAFGPGFAEAVRDSLTPEPEEADDAADE